MFAAMMRPVAFLSFPLIPYVLGSPFAVYPRDSGQDAAAQVTAALSTISSFTELLHGCTKLNSSANSNGELSRLCSTVTSSLLRARTYHDVLLTQICNNTQDASEAESDFATALEKLCPGATSEAGGSKVKKDIIATEPDINGPRYGDYDTYHYVPVPVSTGKNSRRQYGSGSSDDGGVIGGDSGPIGSGSFGGSSSGVIGVGGGVIGAGSGPIGGGSSSTGGSSSSSGSGGYPSSGGGSEGGGSNFGVIGGDGGPITGGSGPITGGDPSGGSSGNGGYSGGSSSGSGSGENGGYGSSSPGNGGPGSGSSSSDGGSGNYGSNGGSSPGGSTPPGRGGSGSPPIQSSSIAGGVTGDPNSAFTPTKSAPAGYGTIPPIPSSSAENSGIVTSNNPSTSKTSLPLGYSTGAGNPGSVYTPFSSGASGGSHQTSSAGNDGDLTNTLDPTSYAQSTLTTTNIVTSTTYSSSSANSGGIASTPTTHTSGGSFGINTSYDHGQPLPTVKTSTGPTVSSYAGAVVTPPRDDGNSGTSSASDGGVALPSPTSGIYESYQYT